jgi:hypothetical protein
MADEITVGIRLKVDNGQLDDEIVFNTDLVTQNTADPIILRKVESIPTTAGGTAISTTGITTLGWMYVKNLDGTNYVTIGPDSGGSIVSFIKLKPGEHCVFRLQTGITIRMLANTAAVRVLYALYDD